MTSINVSAELLGKNLADYASGKTEIVGIVMRDRKTKVVTSWLRDTGVKIGDDGSLPTQSAKLLKSLNLPLEVLPALQLANLAVSAAGFAAVLRKLDKLDRKLESMLAQLKKIGEDVHWIRELLDEDVFARLRSAARKLSLPALSGSAERRVILSDLIDIGEALQSRCELLISKRQGLARGDLLGIYSDYLRQCIQLQLSVCWTLDCTESAVSLGREWTSRLSDLAERMVSPVSIGSADVAQLRTFATVSEQQRCAAGNTNSAFRETTAVIEQQLEQLEFYAMNGISPTDLAAIDAAHPGQLVLLQAK